MAACLTVTSACGEEAAGTQKGVSRADFGDAWPLTVANGTLECRAGNRVVFTTNGTTYAVNGLAKGDGAYRDLDSIWADDPNVSGLKKDMSRLTDEGLALCSGE